MKYKIGDRVKVVAWDGNGSNQWIGNRGIITSNDGSSRHPYGTSFASGTHFSEMELGIDFQPGQTIQKIQDGSLWKLTSVSNRTLHGTCVDTNGSSRYHTGQCGSTEEFSHYIIVDEAFSYREEDKCCDENCDIESINNKSVYR